MDKESVKRKTSLIYKGKFLTGLTIHPVLSALWLLSQNCGRSLPLIFVTVLYTTFWWITLIRIWEPKFIFDSYACRKNKGIHLGVRRLQGFLRKVTRNGSMRAFYLQLDIENFFMSIDKKILYALISDKVRDESILWLAKILIYHDCTKDYVLKGDRDYLKKIAPQKSLFYTMGRKGLPIGNLTSQFLAVKGVRVKLKTLN